MYKRIAIALLAGATLLSAAYVSAADVSPEQHHDSILLVAARHMMDPNFARTVVLVMFPTDSGPSGVILNRPSRVMLRDVWPDDTQRQGRTDRLFIGGPVEPDGLLFLFRMTPPPERAWWAIDDIFFSGDGYLLETLLETHAPDPAQRFFAGYAGWAPGQLENEIARGDWHVLAADPKVIYDTEPGTLWQRMYQRATLPRAHGSPQRSSLAYHTYGAKRYANEAN